MGTKSKACKFGHCMLPKNNNKYILQFLFLFFSFTSIVIKSDSITFLSLILFSVPIVMDLCFWDGRSSFVNCIRWLFIIINIFIIMVGFLGQSSFMFDTGDAFSIVESSLFFPGLSVHKSIMTKILFVNCFVPVVLFFSCPNQKFAAAHAAATAHMGGTKK